TPSRARSSARRWRAGGSNVSSVPSASSSTARGRAIHLVCARMRAADLGIPLGSFWADNSHWISAVISLAVAFLVAYLVDRAFQRRGRKLAETMRVSREAATRLRFVRRLIYGGILLLGGAVALSQFS